jgi:hypothetical protein
MVRRSLDAPARTPRPTLDQYQKYITVLIEFGAGNAPRGPIAIQSDEIAMTNTRCEEILAGSPVPRVGRSNSTNEGVSVSNDSGADSARPRELMA